ncbi:hypothetical protein [Candidatus Sulfurimonas baltica]|uniref:Uncharacterized protein n=1 Tax=Candidatus Sulfurimonas baltica TaxID=2740404 RepID=A0A7S7LST5_9BACT|nr:hypothetical protein [Candidatus Sulfurimonas baltica]QOY50911.1 hypothetical protein HUE88_07080 [Candidatus Sulfurimonas baltica]
MKNSLTTNYTKVSSATGSKIATGTATAISGILKDAKKHNIYVIAEQWTDDRLALAGLFLGDDATKATHSVMDNVNDRTIDYDLVKASSKKEVKNFINYHTKLMADTTIYIVKSTRDVQPSYEFIALGSTLNVSTIKEVPYDGMDNLYYLSTDRACFDFVSADMVA